MFEVLSESVGMFTKTKAAVSPLVMAMLLAGGCSGSPFDTSIHSEPGAAKKPALSAEASVQALVDGLKASKPIALWDFLDSNQQECVNAVVRGFVDVVDPEVWEAT